MKYIRCSFLVILATLLVGCKDSPAKIESSQELVTSVSDSILDPLDQIDKEQERDLENAYYYVTAPSGLALRKADVLSSDKIATIPYGAKVKQGSPLLTVDLTVENVDGSMMEVDFEGKTGYAFSGFLSPFPMPIKDEAIEIYVQRLQKEHPRVLFKETPTGPDFHEGIVQTLSLPTHLWHEAFFLAKAQFAIPSSMNFPGNVGAPKNTIAQADKEASVWSSDLFVSRSANRLDTIQYNWRAEGSGYWVMITEPTKGQMVIEYTVFVD